MLLLQTWERICEASRNEFDQLYKRLDVSIVWRGESFYNPRLAPLVDQLMQQGVAEESDGAQARAHPYPISCQPQGAAGGGGGERRRAGARTP